MSDTYDLGYKDAATGEPISDQDAGATPPLRRHCACGTTWKTPEGMCPTCASEDYEIEMIGCCDCRHQHERDLLADALGRVLVASGVTTTQPLTGPELLLLADDYATHLEAAR